MLSRVLGKIKGFAALVGEKIKAGFSWLGAKIKKGASIAGDKLAAVAPEISMKVKKGVLISLGAIITLAIVSAVTINSYAKDLHEFEGDKCVNCGISSSLVYKFTYNPENDTYSISGRGIWNGLYDEVILPESYKGKTVAAISDTAFDNAKILKSVVIPEGVTYIGEGAFLGCGQLKEVSLPEGLSAIGKEAFCACPRLDGVELPATLEALDVGAFYNCTALSAITLPDSLSEIGNFAFEGCKNLKSLKVGTSLATIGDMAFAFCNLDEVSGESETFYTEGGCLIEAATGTVVIGTNKSVIPNGVTAIGKYAFSSRYLMETLTLPESVTDIGHFAFFDCESLKSADLGKVVTIGYKAFYSCSALKEVTLPDTLTVIGEEAFSNCSLLAKIVIPDSVTEIRTRAFSNCGSLTEVVIGSGVNYIGDKAFLFCANITSLTFADPEGWYVTKDSALADGEAVSSMLLGDKSEAHTLITGEYKNHYWYKK